MSSGFVFKTFNPNKDDFNEQCYHRDSLDQVEEKLVLVEKAAQIFAQTEEKELSLLLKQIKSELLVSKNIIHQFYCSESGLDDARFENEFNRTLEQIDHFSDYILSKDWRNNSHIKIEKGDKSFKKIKRPLGPILVLGASNFPLAYSTIGGDSLAALAAKCPVIIKAHPYHVGTSLEVMKAIERAIEKTSLPKSIFTHFIDDEYTLAEHLCKHATVKGIGFTGSLSGGKAIMAFAKDRPVPIPVFAEMGSTNPVIIMKGGQLEEVSVLANKIAYSVCNDRGQFCTKPGLIFIPKTDYGLRLCSLLKTQITTFKSGPMLHPKIKERFEDSISRIKEISNDVHESRLEKPFHVANTLAVIDQRDFKTNSLTQSEIFGPYTTVIMYDDNRIIEKYLCDCTGQLTCSVFSNNDSILANRYLIDLAMNKVGRMIINDVPTGVVVSKAMQHGGPFPASSDSRFTAVGSSSIFRFVRDVTIQKKII